MNSPPISETIRASAANITAPEAVFRLLFLGSGLLRRSLLGNWLLGGRLLSGELFDRCFLGCFFSGFFYGH